MTATTNVQLEEALALIAAGISVVPIPRLKDCRDPEKGKIPNVRWSRWKLPAGEVYEETIDRKKVERTADGIMSEADACRHWGVSEPPGIAAIGGAVSGGLECLDFDYQPDETHAAWAELVEATCPGLVARLTLVRTPSGGLHHWYRVVGDMGGPAPVPGNTKLAMNGLSGPDAKPLAETRGTGGYALVPGTPPECHPAGREYEVIAGPHLRDVAEVTEEEREVMGVAARSLDRTPPPAAPALPQESARPGDEFDRRGWDWHRILVGWELAMEVRGLAYWRRPGKDGRGWSATTGVRPGGLDMLFVFTASVPGLKQNACYGKFRAYAALHHGGDCSAACRAITANGEFGGPRRLPRQASPAPQSPDAFPPGGGDGPDRDPFEMGIVPDMPRPFPAAPDPSVFYGIFGEIVGRLQPETAADPIAILVHLLTMFGGIIGRNAYWMAEGKRHYGNLFAVVIGDSSKGLKGTSRERAEQVFREIDPDWVRDNIDGGLSSGEGLIYAVRDARRGKQPVKGRSKGDPVEYEDVIEDHGVADKRLLFVENEFAQLLAKAELDGSSLVSNLRKAWDGGKLSNRTKTPLTATNSHISLIGHITPDELAARLNRNDVSNGFFNRFWWMASMECGRHPRGGRAVDLTREARGLKFVIQKAYTAGEVGMDDEAWDYWENPVGTSLFDRLKVGRPGALASLCARAVAHVRDAAMIYALSDGATVVRLHHLRAAEELWGYCERTMGWAFGSTSVGDAVADNILSALRSAGAKGVTRAELSAHFHNRNTAVIAKSLGRLIAQGVVAEDRLPTKGRPTHIYRLSQEGGVCEITK